MDRIIAAVGLTRCFCVLMETNLSEGRSHLGEYAANLGLSPITQMTRISRIFCNYGLWSCRDGMFIERYHFDFTGDLWYNSI